MPNASAQRFSFIAAALRGDGPFRPRVVATGSGTEVTLSGESVLVRYPRESSLKYARRNEVAFYDGPLVRACSRFVGYLAAKAVSRELTHDLYRLVADNVDGKGNAIDVFWMQFAIEAKARGSMLLQVEMPAAVGETRAQQLAERRVPYWMPLAPELVTDYALGDDGKFDFVEYGGQLEGVECVWHFDREGWSARDKEQRTLAEGMHPLGECPVLIFTESGDFPSFGPFAPIADVARRLMNAESELDELIRSQTFSIFHLPVPEGSTDSEKLAAAKVAGETIGTQNLIVHTGAAPGFVAPPDGPAKVCIERIKMLEAKINEIGLNVATVAQQESGFAMQMRFAQINAELSRFAARMEDLERRAWDLSRRWLAMQAAPAIQWPRDFNLADVEQELRILNQMQGAAMPAQVIAEQQRRIVAVQFGGLDQERMDEITQAIDERALEPEPAAPDEATATL